MLHEKRQAYQKFAEEINSCFARVALGSKINDQEGHHEHYLRVVAVSSNLIVYAPKEVIKACQMYSQTVFEYSDMMGLAQGYVGYSTPPSRDRKAVHAEAKQRRRAAMLSIRNDLYEREETASTEAVNAFFVLTPLDEEAK
ncbi:hypothetical protein [Roseovarius sp. Pro17]|uniref:hypothetical protein n=1 Tax=Roseovarius sp. Pro17 TaxID=3108175 RepID=UPI002D767CF7|nr:hypothetical protein [Roseovarius sp. Pro17]